MPKQIRFVDATFYDVTEIRIENDPAPNSTVLWIRLIHRDSSQSLQQYDGTRLSCFHPGDDTPPRVFVDGAEIAPNPVPAELEEEAEEA